MPANHVYVLTAPGAAAIAVIRLSGPAIESFLQRRFSKPVPVGRCVHGLLRDGDQTIDDPVAVRTHNTLDLNLHGSIWVIHSVLELAKTDGFELVDSAADNADSALWADLLKSLPFAKTEQAVRMLLAQPAAWENLGDLNSILADQGGWWMLATPRVAIAGPPNVGKSTLANQLFGQQRSIAADLPGTTRDWVGEIANIDGLAVMLVDTPGIRTTLDPIEREAISASREEIQNADLVVLVLDQSLPLDRSLIDAYPSALCVANKSDAPASWNAAEIRAISTVATTGAGLAELRKEIRRKFDCEPWDPSRARWWTQEQRQVLTSNGSLSRYASTP